MTTTIVDPIWPGPRLLVPILVEALLIGQPNQNGSWSKTQIDYAQLPYGNPVPPPFDTTRLPPGTGVHLAWAMPYSLRHGQAGASGDSNFPLLPNRWIITRSAVTAPGAVPLLTAWVLQSDFSRSDSLQGSVSYPDGDGGTRYIGKRYNYSDWTNPQSGSAFLSAVGPGEISWSVVYDNVKNVFSFYDDLLDAANGSYSYSVAGWYATPADDPLFNLPYWSQPTATPEDWASQVALYNWSLGSTEQLYQAIATWELWLSQHPIEGGPEIPEKMQNLPAQLLLHGFVFQIAWTGPQSAYPINPILEGKNPPVVAIGANTPESLSAYLADRLGDPKAEPLLNAFQMDLIYNYTHDPLQFAAELQNAGFSLAHAVNEWLVALPPVEGQTAETVPSGSASLPLDAEQTLLLTQLNHSQYQLDQAQNVLITTEWELLAAGWKQTFVSPRDTSLKAQINATVEALIASVETQQAQIALLSSQRDSQRDALTAALGDTYQLSVVQQRRFNQALDPVVLVAGGGQDDKYGPPTNSGNNPLLFSRFTGQTIFGLQVTYPVNGTNQTRLITLAQLGAIQWPVGSGVPMEIPDFWVETFFLDTANAQYLASLFFQLTDAPQPWDISGLAELIRTQQTLVWNESLQLDQQTLAAVAGLQGTIPNKNAVQLQTPPWSPIYLDWELAWSPSAGTTAAMLDDWTLGQVDFQWKGAQVSSPVRLISSRSVLSASAASGLADKLLTFLSTSPYLDQLPAYSVQELRDAAAYLASTDIMTQALTGLTQRLIDQLGQIAVNYPKQDQRIPELTQDAPSYIPDPGTTTALPPGFWPIRAGHFQLTKLQLVDVFGQILTATQSGETLFPIRSSSLLTPGGDTNQRYVQLAPRITQGARFDLRALDASDDAIPANSSDLSSPIAGWLIPNHIDDSLTLFDPAGNNLGAILPLLTDSGTGTRWDAVPGSSLPLGAPPNIQNAHADAFAAALLRRGASGSDALRELLDLLDTALYLGAGSGQPLQGNLDALVGAPLALVRAAVSFQLDGNPATNQAWSQTGKNDTSGFTAVNFPLQLGDLLLRTNGLIGYFLDDDYDLLYSARGYNTQLGLTRRSLRAALRQPHPSGPALLAQLRASARSALLAPTATSSSGYIVTDHSFYLPPDTTTTRYLTLIVDPRGWIPLFTGAQPYEYLTLAPGPVASALANMFVTFRIGPLLVDPDQIKMPLPAQITGKWNWVERQGLSLWRQSEQLQQPDPRPLLPLVPPTLREGWLRLSGAFGSNT